MLSPRSARLGWSTFKLHRRQSTIEVARIFNSSPETMSVLYNCIVWCERKQEEAE